MTWIEAIAVAFGLLGVWLTVRQSIWCWPTGLVQVVLYVWIFYLGEALYGLAHPRLAQLADNAINRYDLFFLCADDIPYEDTWDRSGDVYRSVFQKQIRADLLRRRIPFITLMGSLASRLETVLSVMHGFDKWESINNNLKRKDGN